MEYYFNLLFVSVSIKMLLEPVSGSWGDNIKEVDVNEEQMQHKSLLMLSQ